MVDIKIEEIGANKEVRRVSDEYELCIIILSGYCDVEVENGKYTWENLGQEKSVFEQTPDSIYIPCKSAYKLTTLKSILKVAIVSVNAVTSYEPFVIRGNKLSGEIRGKNEWKRTVYNMIMPCHSVDSMIVGQTIHTGGVWSGYPPHKHDTNDGDKESKNIEMYYVEIEPRDAFAVFIQYGQDWEKSTIIKHGDCILVEKGYHAIVSAAGTKFYYIWALDSEKHKFICNSDEKYDWLKG